MSAFEQVYCLEEKKYLEDCPVGFEKMVLSKEVATGRIVYQGKYFNISNKKIKTLKIRLQGYDTAGRLLEDSIYYEYLDLNVKRGETFGGNVPVLLKNKSIRRVTLHIDEVLLEDGSFWRGQNAEWKVLPRPRSAKNVIINEPVVLNQYQKNYGATFSEKFEDFWFCSCGALNRNDETSCWRCGKTYIEFSEAEKDRLIELDIAEKIATEEKKKKMMLAVKNKGESTLKTAKKIMLAVKNKGESTLKTAKNHKLLIAIIVALLAVVVIINFAKPFITDLEYVAKKDLCGVYTTAQVSDGGAENISSVNHYTFRISHGSHYFLIQKGSWNGKQSMFTERDDKTYVINKFTLHYIKFSEVSGGGLKVAEYCLDFDDMELELPDGTVENVTKLK